MTTAREMGMSETEFWNCDPIFFNECYEAYVNRQIRKAEALYGR